MIVVSSSRGPAVTPARSGGAPDDRRREQPSDRRTRRTGQVFTSDDVIESDNIVEAAAFSPGTVVPFEGEVLQGPCLPPLSSRVAAAYSYPKPYEYISVYA